LGPVIYILTAVELEARFIARALGLTREQDQWRSAGEQSLIVRPAGIRAIGLPPLDRAQNLRCVMLAGFAGALDPALKVGDVVLDDCPQGWTGNFDGRRGRIYTSPEIVGNAEQKAALFRQTAALAVDMESDIVRGWATKAAAPFVSIRAISDSAEQSLDPAILRLVDPFGRLKPLALTAQLLRRPSLIADLQRLRVATNLAGVRLGEAVRGLVQQVSEAPDGA
jgi:adenosylhomocysteine nucleosidase